MSELTASRRVVALGHMGEVYLYHQLWGYILKMSPDVYDLWSAFEGGAEKAFICRRFESQLTGQGPSELIDILVQFRCLDEPGADELEDALDGVPVKGKWNVWRRGDDGAITLWTAWGDRPEAQHSLSLAETAVWDAIDGETKARALAADHGRDVVISVIKRCVALEVQALKLSPVPLSVFGGRHKWPPYLTSTMPYALLDGVVPGIPELAEYHRERIRDPSAQFDHKETTLAHLLRRPHLALAGRRYGEALIEGLVGRGFDIHSGPMRILEIGGGLGDLAAAVIDELAGGGAEPRYQIVELAPALAECQRARLTDYPVEVTEADVLAVDLPTGAFDLVIANEMIGDLPATPLADAGAWVERYGLDVEGAPEDTVLTTGAFRLIELIDEWLAPGATAVITEFGERSVFPKLSTHLDHPELSAHFGHLESVARGLGLDAEMVFSMDLIDLDRDREGLATTRSYFRALTALLADVGVTLEKIGYTREMFDELVGEPLAPGSYGDIYFDRIEDRLMGLVPHEFKALVAVKAR